MYDFRQPLIVGAGPVGLGAALFLAKVGVKTRVIEELSTPSPHSRALAVNPRTLHILKSTGVTDRMLAQGLIIRGARLWRGDQVAAEFTFQGLPHKYPYMLALSQAATERLLEEALIAAGGSVERGVRLVVCREHADGAEVELEDVTGESQERLQCACVLAADGRHTVLRSQLSIDFPGSSLKGDWFLADVPLATDLPADLAHVFFLDEGGFIFLPRVVGGEEERWSGDPLWRVISSFPDALGRLVHARATGPAVWNSGFHVAHRMNARLQTEHVYFAGDAAHIHSPMGARGMNLGLEDAWVFAQLVCRGDLQSYERLRRPVDRSVVRNIELLTRVVIGESLASRFARGVVLPKVMRFESVRGRMMALLTGLDHPWDAGLKRWREERVGTGEPMEMGLR